MIQNQFSALVKIKQIYSSEYDFTNTKGEKVAGTSYKLVVEGKGSTNPTFKINKDFFELAGFSDQKNCEKYNDKQVVCKFDIVSRISGNFVTNELILIGIEEDKK
jgi:hypothetical protein